MEGVEYHPHTGEFSSSLHRINFIMWNQYLKKLSNILENTTHQFDAQKVGIYLVSFDEVTSILIQSDEHYDYLQSNIARNIYCKLDGWNGSNDVSSNSTNGFTLQ